MVTIDSSYVERELKAIAAASRTVSKLLRRVFEQLERDPSTYPRLDDVPQRVAESFPNAVLRKVYLEHGRHSFRLVLVHWTFKDPKEATQQEHVDIIYAFPRKRGYAIDWNEVGRFLREAE